MSKKNLVIVESPTKAKTIEKFLSSDYRVLSSQGHIRDIEGTGKNSVGVDFEHQYAPHYVIDSQKEHLIATLKDAAKKADTIWLASDEDREGEAIAWHLKEVLQLPDEKTHRIVFHEITPSAIEEAIAHPRDIDYNLVNAQQTRRIIDRIVGYELSPVLWKKISVGLSAGRVQSVAVRLIVEKEREIEKFVSAPQYRITADFIGANGKESLHAELNKRFETKEEAIAFLEACRTASFQVNAIQTKPAKRTPAPPFITSSLQQEAARKLKFPVGKTMRLAQALYEAGRITYMRTDSVNLSTLALNTCKAEILDEFGAKYHQARRYRTTSKGAQEAHEAIRPTFMNVRKAGANADEQHLYELIWKRTLASQMADAQVENTRIEVSISSPSVPQPTPYTFIANGEVVLFDGFMRAYVQSNDDGEEEHVALPHMTLHESLSLQEVVGTETFSKPPYRYTEASLVKKLEDLGIGRPSTYASIIETILSRHYVERGSVEGVKKECNILTLKNGRISDRKKTEVVGSDHQKLLPTDLGRMTNDFLVDQFPSILDYDFTAKEEEKFDKVAVGKADWIKTIDTFYKAFHPLLAQVPTGKVHGRLLGTDPVSGEPVFARISKTGPCIQIGDSAKDKPRFASLKPEQSIYSITLEEALQLFEKQLPITLGEEDGEAIIVGEGKFGPYIRKGKTYVSIPKHINPMQISLEEGLRLLHHSEDMLKPIAVFGDTEILNGRYGPYIKTPEGNFKIPKGRKPESLTEIDCKAIIEAAKEAEKGGKRTFRRKNKK